MKKYQFINYFPKWQGLYFRRAVYSMAEIYEWYLWIGFLEIRKWRKRWTK